MSLTSFRSDPARVKKEMEISTYSGQYFLNTPGPGVHNMPFIEDVHVRLQSWGANYCGANQFLDVENDLRGASRKLTKDGSHHMKNKYRQYSQYSQQQSNHYRKMEPFVKESRMSHPAWMLRDWDNQYTRWEQPWLNPQAHTHIPFEHNVYSKQQARDSVIR